MSAEKTILGYSTGEDPYAFSQADCEIVVACIGGHGAVNANTQLVADRVDSWMPDAIVSVGPNSLVGNYYNNYVTRGKFWPCPGQDDYSDASGDAYLDYFDEWIGRRFYYKKRLGPVEFYLLNSIEVTPEDHLVSGLQYLWLVNEIAGSKAAWKVVALYHDPFTSDSTIAATTTARWNFGALGVHLVLSGRSRTYERILPATDLDAYYIVNGLGGEPRTEFGDTVAGSIIRRNDSFGSGRLTVSPNKLLWEFISAAGAKLDCLQLHKELPAVECGDGVSIEADV